MTTPSSAKRPDSINYAAVVLIGGVLVTVVGAYAAVVLPDYRWFAILLIVLSWLGVAAWYVVEPRPESKRVGRTVRRAWGRGGGWKVVAIAGGVLIAFLLVLAGTIFLLGWLIKGLAVGGVRNLDLYLPRSRRR